MRRVYYLLSLLLVATLSVAASEPQKSPLLRDGDKVNFVGNSITHGGNYNNYIMRYYITRYPKMKVDFFNLGVSGDTADGLVRRMDDDILANQPDVAIMMIGMNDAGVVIYADTSKMTSWQRAAQAVQKYENYKNNITQVLDKLRPSVRDMVVFTPSIYDQTLQSSTVNFNGANDALFTFGEYLKQIAPKYSVRIADMWQQTNSVNIAMQQDDPTQTVISNDRIHPLQLGGYVMAYRFLKDVGEAEYVSDIAIDARRNRVTKAYNAQVQSVVSRGRALEFEVLEGALPYPMDTMIVKANKYIDFNDTFNRQIFTVNSLAKGSYTLMIDSVVVGKYTAQELASGVNLATNSATPQYQQAVAVAKMCDEIWRKYNDYRVFAMVDYLLLRQKDVPETVAQRIEDAKQRIESDPTSWLVGIYKYYIENKTKQAEINNHIRELSHAIYDHNQPTKHTYRLVYDK